MFTDSQPSDDPQVPNGATPVESPSGKIIGWTQTRIVRNGSPRHYDVVWAPVVKLFAGAVLTLGVAGFSASVASIIVTNREVAVLKAQLAIARDQVERAAKLIEDHANIPYHQGVFQHFLTKEEYYRDRTIPRRR